MVVYTSSLLSHFNLTPESVPDVGMDDKVPFSEHWWISQVFIILWFHIYHYCCPTRSDWRVLLVVLDTRWNLAVWVWEVTRLKTMEGKIPEEIKSELTSKLLDFVLWRCIDNCVLFLMTGRTQSLRIGHNQPCWPSTLVRLWVKCSVPSSLPCIYMTVWQGTTPTWSVSLRIEI